MWKRNLTKTESSPAKEKWTIKRSHKWVRGKNLYELICYFIFIFLRNKHKGIDQQTTRIQERENNKHKYTLQILLKNHDNLLLVFFFFFLEKRSTCFSSLISYHILYNKYWNLKLWLRQVASPNYNIILDKNNFLDRDRQ